MILAMLFMVLMLDKTEHPATTQNPVPMRTLLQYRYKIQRNGCQEDSTVIEL